MEDVQRVESATAMSLWSTVSAARPGEGPPLVAPERLGRSPRLRAASGVNQSSYQLQHYAGDGSFCAATEGSSNGWFRSDRTENDESSMPVASTQHQIIRVTSGLLTVQGKAGLQAVKPGRAVWIPRHYRHVQHAYGRIKMSRLVFDAVDVDRTASPAVAVVSPELGEAIDVFARPAGKTRTTARELALRETWHRAVQQPNLGPVPRDPRLAKACSIVAADLADSWLVGDLARQIGVSEYILAQLFQREFGTTYLQWRTNVRVAAALVLLAEGEPPVAVAAACGWSSRSAFGQAFERVLGERVRASEWQRPRRTRPVRRVAQSSRAL